MKELLDLKEAEGIIDLLLRRIPNHPNNEFIKTSLGDAKGRILQVVKKMESGPIKAKTNVLEEKHLELTIQNLEFDVNTKDFELQAKKARHDERCQESKLRAELLEQQIKTETATTAVREREVELGKAVTFLSKEIEQLDKTFKEKKVEQVGLFHRIREGEKRLGEITERLTSAQAALKKVEAETNERAKALSSSPLKKEHKGRRKEETDAPLTVPLGEAVAKENSQS